MRPAIEGLVLGTIEHFGAPAGFFKGVDPRFQVLEVPAVFESPRHAHATITDPKFRTPFLELGVPKGVKGVSVWIYGPTSYASLKPLRRIDDFKGKKFRVLATKVETEVMRRLGATGVPMPYLDTIQALQRRAIDGSRSNIVVMNSTKHWTVAKYITVVDDTYIPCVGFISMSFYNKRRATCRKPSKTPAARSRASCTMSGNALRRVPRRVGATAVPRSSGCRQRIRGSSWRSSGRSATTCSARNLARARCSTS